MRSVFIAAIAAAGTLTLIETSPRAYTPRPASPALVIPITMVDDDLGVGGVSISKAGQSKQSRMNYLNSFLQETQGNVRARCAEVLDTEAAASGVVAFCKDVMPGK